MTDSWGPLARLGGEWEGEGGLDTAYSHAEHSVLATPFREKLSFKPFGPVQNGRQSLFGLDYRSAMWRGSEENPFHTEVGYWLFDATTGEIMRAFVVPRGIAVLVGGTAERDATSFTLNASADDPQYAIGENKYLAENASTTSYAVTVTIDDDRTFDVPRDHDAQDGRVRRALRPHRPQHPAPRRLTETPVRPSRSPRTPPTVVGEIGGMCRKLRQLLVGLWGRPPVRMSEADGEVGHFARHIDGSASVSAVAGPDEGT